MLLVGFLSISPQHLFLGLRSQHTLLPSLCHFRTCKSSLLYWPLLAVSGLQWHQEVFKQPSSSRTMAFSELLPRSYLIWERFVTFARGQYIMLPSFLKVWCNAKYHMKRWKDTVWQKEAINTSDWLRRGNWWGMGRKEGQGYFFFFFKGKISLI